MAAIFVRMKGAKENENQQIKATLTRYVKRYIPIDEDVINSLLESSVLLRVQKKDFLLKPGQQCTQQYFVLSGCFRSYYIDEKGQEQVMNFAIENWWMTDYISYVNEVPSTLYFQALEDAELMAIEKEKLETLFDQHPRIERLFRLIAEKSYIASQRRIEFMLSMSRQQSYEHFESSTYPFSERIPQYMIASYLGFTPEFLSMIRSRKRKGKS